MLVAGIEEHSQDSRLEWKQKCLSRTRYTALLQRAETVIGVGRLSRLPAKKSCKPVRFTALLLERKIKRKQP